LVFGDPMAKRLEILHQVVPNAAVIAQLVDLNFQYSVSHVAEVKDAAQSLGLQVIVLGNRTAADINKAFSSLFEQGARAIVVGPGGLHFSLREQIVALATHYAIPTIYPFREFALDGGLISYGNRPQDGFYWAGVYVGRILEGEKPVDLPVIEATKFELVINLKTAKTLGLTIAPILLTTADDVIE
jgi:putative tryptophan/tyrosine transport system substrate-binding protein